MNAQKFAQGIANAVLGLIMLVLIAIIVGFPFMWLWNWLMPVVFSLPHIGFWQGWGLLVMSGILFKSSK